MNTNPPHPNELLISQQAEVLAATLARIRDPRDAAGDLSKRAHAVGTRTPDAARLRDAVRAAQVKVGAICDLAEQAIEDGVPAAEIAKFVDSQSACVVLAIRTQNFDWFREPIDGRPGDGLEDDDD